MPTELKKEILAGKYDGNTPSNMLPYGSISDGKNVRMVGVSGGWAPRRGSTLLNTSAAGSGQAIKSFHFFQHPSNLDGHLIVQTNNTLLNKAAETMRLLLEQDNNSCLLNEDGGWLLGTVAGSVNPMAQGITLGSDMGVTVGSTPGFSDIIGDNFVYADPSTNPITYAGDYPYCKAFLMREDNNNRLYDLTDRVTNSNEDDYAVLYATHADDELYVCADEPISGIQFRLGTNANTNSSTPSAHAWSSSGWSARPLTDGTGGALQQTGTMSWTVGTDVPTIIGGIYGYWYRVSLTAALERVDLVSVHVVQPAHSITPKWDGTWRSPTAVQTYDASATSYEKKLGDTTDDSELTYIDLSDLQGSGAAWNANDQLLIKTPEPATAFWIGVPSGYSNDQAATTSVEVLTGDGWKGCTGENDQTSNGTNPFTRSGPITFTEPDAGAQKVDNAYDDHVSGYWYRISLSASLTGTSGRIYSIYYAAKPTIEKYSGVVEFQSRAFFWGGRYQNRLFYTAQHTHDSVTGDDSGWTLPFGGNEPILRVLKWYDDIVVFKEKEVFFLSGASPATYSTSLICTDVGLANAYAALVVGDDFPSTSQDDPLSVVIWQDVDGVYVLDKQKPRKISMPVDHYFNRKYPSAIEVEYINSLNLFADAYNRELHFIGRRSENEKIELVYNYVLDAWYPPFERAMPLSFGLQFRADDGADYVLGGTFNGFILLLEQGTSDKNESNSDVAIEHSIKTRAIGSDQKLNIAAGFKLYELWPELKSQSAGSAEIRLYTDMEDSSVALTNPSAPSLVNPSKGLVVPRLKSKTDLISCFEVEIRSNTVDVEVEVYSILYTTQDERTLPAQ